MSYVSKRRKKQIEDFHKFVVFASSFVLVFCIILLFSVYTIRRNRSWYGEVGELGNLDGFSLSEFGKDEFECSGFCFCELSGERRSNFANFKSKPLIFTLSALSSVVAFKISEILIQDRCEAENFECPESSTIRSEVSDCSQVSKSSDDSVTENEVHVILGSESVNKRKVFGEIFPVFEKSYTEADIDEKSIRSDSAENLVLVVSHAKADRIITDELMERKEGYTNILVTADIIVRVNGQILEKPEDEAEARQMIHLWGSEDGSVTETVCGVVVVNLETGERFEGVDVVNLEIMKIPKPIEDELVSIGTIMRCCGALTLEQPMPKYIKRIDGEISSVLGLPEKLTKDLVYRALKTI